MSLIHNNATIQTQLKHTKTHTFKQHCTHAYMRKRNALRACVLAMRMRIPSSTLALLLPCFLTLFSFFSLLPRIMLSHLRLLFFSSLLCLSLAHNRLISPTPWNPTPIKQLPCGGGISLTAPQAYWHVGSTVCKFFFFLWWKWSFSVDLVWIGNNRVVGCWGW